MKVYINHSFKYDVYHLAKTFFFTVEMVDEKEDALINEIRILGEKVYITIKYKNINWQKNFESYNEKEIKHFNTLFLYDFLSDYTKRENPYGILVGVRPLKLMHKLMDQKCLYEEIKENLYINYRITKEKIDLLYKTALVERTYLKGDNLSVYICIPFCPSRCIYCSFPSNDLNKKGSLLEQYLESLLKEIKLIEKYKEKVDCIYIGGGTPGILSYEQFELIFKELDCRLDLKSLKEFTVEIGRPNTITDDKLRLFKEYYVSRICINPQTMNDTTLQLIGRKHNAKDIIDKMNLAKKYHFDVINMDIILGLPGESIKDVKDTVDKILALQPENITVHTLSIKSASNLKNNVEENMLLKSNEIKEMLSYVEENLLDYRPYYLYRQKNILGNFENIGYAKKEKESLYNIRIIEERHTILAFGAGASSKFVQGKKLSGYSNAKGIEDYIKNIDKMIKDKVKLLEEYGY